VSSSQCLVSSLKRKRKSHPTLRDGIVQELDRLIRSPPERAGKMETFLLGDLSILLNIREEFHRNLLAGNPATPKQSSKIGNVKPLFVISYQLPS
jgi:hypothetical protein